VEDRRVDGHEQMVRDSWRCMDRITSCAGASRLNNLNRINLLF